MSAHEFLSPVFALDILRFAQVAEMDGLPPQIAGTDQAGTHSPPRASQAKPLHEKWTPTSAKTNSILPVYIYNDKTGVIERKNLELRLFIKALLFPEVRENSIFMSSEALSAQFIRAALPLSFDLDVVFQALEARLIFIGGRWHRFPELNASVNSNVESDVAKYYETLASVAEAHVVTAGDPSREFYLQDCSTHTCLLTLCRAKTSALVVRIFSLSRARCPSYEEAGPCSPRFPDSRGREGRQVALA